MTATDVTYWFLVGRAIFGTVALLISIRMMVMSFEDRAVIKDRTAKRAKAHQDSTHGQERGIFGTAPDKIDDMAAVIVNDAVVESVLFLLIFLMLAGTAWLAWPTFHARGPYGVRQAIGSVFVFIVLLLVGIIKFRNWRGYNRLVAMAMELEDAKRKQALIDAR